MNIVNKLTLRHLRLNRGRTAMTLAGIVLSVAMVCAVTGFFAGFLEALRQNTLETTGDFHLAINNIPAETAAIVGENELFSSYYTRENNYGEYYGTKTREGHVNLYLKLARPWKPYHNDFTTLLWQHMDIASWGTNMGLLGLDGGVLSGDGASLMLILAFLIIIGLIVACTVTAIANAFQISSAERVRQFGLLKSVGATGTQIGRSVLFEGFVLLGAAVPVGILLGMGLQAVTVSLANRFIDDLSFRVILSPWVLLATVVIALFTVLLSAWRPARRMAKTPAIDAIRQSKDVRARNHELKVSRLTKKLFGFEGVLASKALKRSKTKHRAAVVSLTLGITLLIAMSSILAFTVDFVEDHYDRRLRTGADIDVYGSLDFHDEVDAALRAIPGAELIQNRYLSGVIAEVPDEFFTDGRGSPAYLTVASLPDDEFRKVAPIGPDRVPGLLVNAPHRYYDGNDLHEYVPYAFDPGLELPFMYTGTMYHNDWPFETAFTVTLAAEIPEQLNFYSWGDILIPESSFRAVCQGNYLRTNYVVTADDPDAFCAAAHALFGGNPDFHMVNYAAEVRQAHNYILLATLFSYGFVLILALISVTSVVTTISTGMALRRREFAMLFSNGMTGAGLNKMLNLESLLYAMKSFLIGFPIGLALSLAAYLLLKTEINKLAYQFPWLAALIAAAAVLLISFGTMRYSKRKLRGVSIVEAIRSEAV